MHGRCLDGWEWPCGKRYGFFRILAPNGSQRTRRGYPVTGLRPLGSNPNTHGLHPNACPVATDFREIYAELFDRLFGLSTHQIGNLIPSWISTNRVGFLI